MSTFLWLLPNYLSCLLGDLLILEISDLLIKKRYSIPIVLAVSLFFMIAYTFAMKAANSRFYDLIYICLINCTVFCLFFVLSKRPFMSQAVAMLNCYVFTCFIGVFVQLIVHWTGIAWLKYIIYCITTPTAALFVWFIYRKLHDEIESIYPKAFNYLIFLGLVAFAFIWGTTIFSAYKTSRAIIVAIIVILFAVFYSCLYILLKNYSRILLDNHDKQMLEKQISAIKLQNSAIVENEQKLAVFRHDIRHYLTTLSAMLESGQSEKAKELLTDINSKIDASAKIMYCKNLTINGVVSNYASLMANNKIPFSAKIVLPDVLHIDETELAVFLCNCLENALNATLKLPEDKRQVTINATSKDDSTIWEISNTFDGKLNTTVADLNDINAEHGIGTHSIQRFAKKNGLSLDYKFTEITVDTSIFSLRAYVSDLTRKQ